MKLIINADDFGLCESVNSAIIDCYLKGNLTSTTLMVNMPGTQHAVTLAKENSKLGIGLHFCLTEGRPLSKCDSLVDKNGLFFSRSKLLKKIFLNIIDYGEVKKEFEMQMDTALKFGINITHVDSHQHVHLIPKIFKTILPGLKKRKLPLRNAYGFVNTNIIFENPVKYLKQVIIKKNISKLRKLYPQTPYFMFSLHDFPELERDNDLYLKMISLLPNSTKTNAIVELIVHPYKDSDDLKKLYLDYEDRIPFFKSCFSEHSVLTNKTLPWDSKNISLINYSYIK